MLSVMLTFSFLLACFFHHRHPKNRIFFIAHGSSIDVASSQPTHNNNTSPSQICLPRSLRPSTPRTKIFAGEGGGRRRGGGGWDIRKTMSGGFKEKRIAHPKRQLVFLALPVKLRAFSSLSLLPLSSSLNQACGCGNMGKWKFHFYFMFFLPKEEEKEKFAGSCPPPPLPSYFFFWLQISFPILSKTSIKKGISDFGEKGVFFCVSRYFFFSRAE